MKAHARDTMLSTATTQARHLMDGASDAYSAAAKQTKYMGKQVDRYVRANPWLAIGAAAGVGVLVGLMLRRK